MTNFTDEPRVLAIVGPTAVGKTELSLDLAETINAEIINADSMQLYRGMDIGTAKVPVSERRGILHHMLDVLDITQSSAVSDYQKQARAVISDIHSRGKRAIVVGGSGLFVSALFERFEFPGNDLEYRSSLEAIYDQDGVPPLFRLLQEASPEAALRIDPSNHRRIIRALEIIKVTGQPPSDAITRLDEVIPSLRIGLRRDRVELDQRIDQRVDQMWSDGLVDETCSLVERGLREGRTARQALGYAQVLSFLDGELSEEQAIELTKSSTRKFARRQDSWFNRDPRINWLPVNDVRLKETILTALADTP